jgi:hypothetical protein
MNVALSAVIIVLLLTPGFAFYIGLFSGKYQKPAPKFSIGESLLIAGLFSLLAHRIAFCFITDSVRFDILLRLLGVDFKENIKTGAPEDNEGLLQLFKNFFLYNALVNIACCLTGILVRFFLIKTGLDWKVSILRLNTKWWYTLNGYQIRNKEFDLIVIDAFVDTREGSFVYTGFLSDFNCDGENLDRIFLHTPMKRRVIRTDKEAAEDDDNNFDETQIEIILENENPAPVTAAPTLHALQPGMAYDLEGDILCLPYREIRNMMIRFIVMPLPPSINTTPAQSVSIDESHV